MRIRRWAPVAWLHHVLPSRLYAPVAAVALTWLAAPFSEFIWILPKLFFVLGYGVYRGLSFYPSSDRGYFSWLMLSPWTPDKPLPKGPVHLTLQDFAILAFVIFGGYGADVLSFGVSIIGFIFIYALCRIPSLMSSRQYLHVFLLFLCLPAVAVGGQIGWAWFSGWAMAILFITWHGTKRSLEVLRRKSLCGRTRAKPYLMLPPGMIMLAGKKAFSRIPLRLAVALAVLAAWWTATVMHVIPQGEFRDVRFAIVLVGATVAVVFGRMKIYRDECLPPMSVAARIKTGRWIIPSYDKVLVAPALLALYGALVASISWKPGLNAAAAGAAVGGLLFLSLALGPTLRRWALTASGRVPIQICGPTSIASAAPEKRVRAFDISLLLPWPRRSRSYYKRFFMTMVAWLLLILVGAGVLVFFDLQYGWSRAGAAGAIVIIIVMLAFPALYGIARVGKFHPVWNADYYRWLQQTPWTPAKPLPLGPFEPRFGDVLLIAAMSVGAFTAVFPLLRGMPASQEALHWSFIVMWAMAGNAVGGYFYMILRTLWTIGRQSEALAICAFLGFVILLFPHGGLMVAVLVIAAAFGIWRLRAAWAAYPWQLPPASQASISMMHRLAPTQGNELLRPCKWLLAAQQPAHVLPPGRRLVLIALSAWILFCLMVRVPHDTETAASWMYIVLVGIAVARISLYLRELTPPGFQMRMATMRLIIPRSDKVWVAPAAGLFTAPVVHTLLRSSDVPLALSVPVSFACAAAILAFAGPSLRNWRLTGAWEQRLRNPSESSSGSTWNK